jgi:hypothetical protein
MVVATAGSESLVKSNAEGQNTSYGHPTQESSLGLSWESVCWGKVGDGRGGGRAWVHFF